MSDGLKMRGVDAAPIAAKMIDCQAGRNLADKSFIAGPVRHAGDATAVRNDGTTTVAVAVNR